MSLSEKSFSLLKRDIFLFITNLITGVVVARKLGPDTMGFWIILQMIPTYAETFGRMKFDIAAVYYLGRNKYTIGDMVFSLNMLAIITSSIIIAPFIWKFDWFYNLLFSNSVTSVSSLIYIMLAQVPLLFLYMNYSYLFIYREDVKRYNMMVVIKALLSSTIAISLLVFFNAGLFAVVFSSVFSTFSGLLYGIIKFGRIEKKGPLLNFPIIKDLIAYGSKLYLAGIISSLNAYVTNLIVVFYLLPAQVAFFNMAQNKGILLNKVPDAMSTILFPRVSKMDDNNLSAQLVAKAFRIILLILSVVGLLALIFIKPLVYILYGRVYLPMVFPFWILLPGLVLSGAAGVLNQYFTGIGRADLTAKIPILPFLLQVIIAILIIPVLGLSGAAIAFLISVLCLSALQIIVFLNISSCTLRSDLMIRKEDVQMVKDFIIAHIMRLKISALRNLLTEGKGG